MLKGGARGLETGKNGLPTPNSIPLESENDQPLSKGQMPFLPTGSPEQLIP